MGDGREQPRRSEKDRGDRERRRRRDEQPAQDEQQQQQQKPRPQNGHDGNPPAGERERRRRRREEEEASGLPPPTSSSTAPPASDPPKERRRRRDEQQPPPPQQQQQQAQSQPPSKAAPAPASSSAKAAPPAQPSQRQRTSSGAKADPQQTTAAKPAPPTATTATAAAATNKLDPPTGTTGNERRSSSAVKADNALGLTYTAFSRQRRALDKYEKRCTYAQLLEKLHTDLYMEVMAGKLQDREHAKREKERCSTSDVMAKQANASSSSAGIMADFYTALLTWGGIPVPPDVRGIVDGMEKRYRAERKAEKERKEEQERQAVEAKAAEIQEEPAGQGEDDEDPYADDQFEDEQEEFDPNTAIVNQQINLEMISQYEQAAKELRRKQGQQKDARASTPSRQNQGMTLPDQRGPSIVDSLQNKKKTSAQDRQLRRTQDILQLVQLDCVSYDMVSMEPVTEYELYMRNFGSNNAEQQATQIPDVSEIEHTVMQTEEITLGHHGAQAPDDLGLAVSSSQDVFESGGGKDGPAGKTSKRLHVDSARLAACVANSAGVFRVLLDESTAHQTAAGASTLQFSSKTTALNTGTYSGRRGAVSVAFSRVALQYCVTVHGGARSDNQSTPAGVYDGMCLVWNINNPSTPDKICIAGGLVTSATFSPHNGYLLYGGSSNGSVYLWDLREPDYLHNPPKRKSENLEILRMPTYSTDHMSFENHCSAIRRVLPVGYNNILMGGKDTDSNEQIATLDEMGNVFIWIVVDVMDKRAFEKDYGLNMGGRLRLFRSATVAVSPAKIGVPLIPAPENAAIKPNLDPYQDNNTRRSVSPVPDGRSRGSVAALWDKQKALPEVSAYDLEFQPDDAAQFLIGSDCGYIIHSSRYGDGAVPKKYRSTTPVQGENVGAYALSISGSDPKHGTHVMAVHYAASTDSRLFLAGLSDGSVSIYKTGWPCPIATLDGFTREPLIVARWSRMHRGIVWAIDAAGVLFVFDLLEDDANKRSSPIVRQECASKSADGKTSYPNDLDFSYDEREPKLAISYSCGKVELHVLRDDLLSGRSSESCGAWLDSVL
ncbi:Cytoplasmic dynein 1 intermediate chain [Diplonema papillatum]|nr:Cytoplasmic dynein 1 intermediate chain [Diplonema papillatum]